MPSLIANALRTALPWIASILGGYVVKDVVDAKQAYKAQAGGGPPANVTDVTKAVVRQNKQRYAWYGIGLLIVGVVTYFITSKIKK